MQPSQKEKGFTIAGRRCPCGGFVLPLSSRYLMDAGVWDVLDQPLLTVNNQPARCRESHLETTFYQSALIRPRIRKSLSGFVVKHPALLPVVTSKHGPQALPLFFSDRQERNNCARIQFSEKDWQTWFATVEGKVIYGGLTLFYFQAKTLTIRIQGANSKGFNAFGDSVFQGGSSCPVQPNHRTTFRLSFYHNPLAIRSPFF